MGTPIHLGTTMEDTILDTVATIGGGITVMVVSAELAVVSAVVMALIAEPARAWQLWARPFELSLEPRGDALI